MPVKKYRNILQVSTRDIGGGAEKVAADLFRAYRSLGHGSQLAVGYKIGDDPDVLRIAHDEVGGAGARFCWSLHRRLQPWYSRSSVVRSLCRLTHRLAAPAGWLDTRRGIEDFHFPGTSRLLQLANPVPDILHLHNLHGHYFDLRALPALSRNVPVVLTLHDAWLLTGHCAHSFDCQKWKTGCGECPDLTIYPAIRRDATAFNWKRKQDIYSQCRLHVATPCQWLMDQVTRSMLAPSIASTRIIPYGVDLTIFHPRDVREARRSLGISPDAAVLLFSANGILRNRWKDYPTMRQAAVLVGRTLAANHTKPREVLFLGLGEEAPPERIGSVELRFVPFQSDVNQVALYYNAADLYIHAARADTFPNAVLEALACGTPVVATSVGGIPEQVLSLSIQSGDRQSAIDAQSPVPAVFGADEATGILVPVGAAEMMATAILKLLGDNSLRRLMGENAVKDAQRRFDLRRQVRDYLQWYEDLLEDPQPDRKREEPALCPTGVV
ncbi:MAG: glycosyltransferase [Planctomycetes bacterium]|nr:glycosyltransferase [Planctomycetota bacterium]